MDKAFNPHWIEKESCRDYQIGNITIHSVPDTFVLNNTKFRGSYGFAQGNVDEFLNSKKEKYGRYSGTNAGDC